MTSVTDSTASLAIKALVSIKSLVGRCVRAVMAARMHGIRHDIEFQRRLNAYRRANGMPLLSPENMRGRFWAI